MTCNKNRKPSTNLIFVDFAVLQLGLSLLLESDDNQGHEDVDEEEWKYDEVDDVENGHLYTKILYGALVLVRGRHRILQDLGPTLASLYREQRKHGGHHVVVVKKLRLPFAFLWLWQQGAVLENEILTPARRRENETLEERKEFDLKKNTHPYVSSVESIEFSFLKKEKKSQKILTGNPVAYICSRRCSRRTCR